MRLTSFEAIAHAEDNGLLLYKYADPVEGFREGLTPDQARDIAKEDPSLIYLDVKDDTMGTAKRRMQMELINLTPHAITLMLPGYADALVIPPSGAVARCTTQRERIDDVVMAGYLIPITRTAFGEVTGLPDEDDDVYCIVSALVAQACPGRDDLLIPDDTVRDAEGRIIGCRALARV